jgi:hypothetical protein
VDLRFHGEIVDFYHKYRHGYPSAVIEVLTEVFGLNARDIAVDLGCGGASRPCRWPGGCGRWWASARSRTG